MVDSRLVEWWSRFATEDRYAVYRFGCRAPINKSPSVITRWYHSPWLRRDELSDECSHPSS